LPSGYEFVEIVKKPALTFNSFDLRSGNLSRTFTLLHTRTFWESDTLQDSPAFLSQVRIHPVFIFIAIIFQSVVEKKASQFYDGKCLSTFDVPSNNYV